MEGYAANSMVLCKILNRVSRLEIGEIEQMVENDADGSEEFQRLWHNRFLGLVYDQRICEVLDIDYRGLGGDSLQSRQDSKRLKLVAMLYVKEAEDTPLPLL